MSNLEIAVGEVFDEVLLSDTDICEHDFSPSFERRMKRLFKRVPAGDKEKTPVMRAGLRYIIAAIILAAILAVTALAIGSDIIQSFSSQIDETHSYFEARHWGGKVVKRSSAEMTVSDENAQEFENVD